MSLLAYPDRRGWIHPAPLLITGHQLAVDLVGCFLLNHLPAVVGAIKWDESLWKTGGNPSDTCGMTVTDGPFGQAMAFDGADDWMSPGDPVTPSPGRFDMATWDFTVSAWIRASSSMSLTAAIMTKGATGAANRGWQWTISATNGSLTIATSDGTTSIARTSSGLPDLRDDKWHHIGVRVIRAGPVQFWRDGVPYSPTNAGALHTVDITGSIAFCIGAQKLTATTAQAELLGSLADVRVWRRLLTPEEMISLYVEPWAMFAQPRRYYMPLADVLGAAAISGTATATAVGQSELPASSTVSGTATATATGQPEAPAAASVSGTATASAAPTLEHAATGAISGTASTTASPAVEVFAQGAASGTATGQAAAQLELPAVGQASGQAAATATAALWHAAAAEASGASATSATGTLEQLGQAAVSGTAVAIATPAIDTGTASATISGTAIASAIPFVYSTTFEPENEAIFTLAGRSREFLQLGREHEFRLSR